MTVYPIDLSLTRNCLAKVRGFVCKDLAKTFTVTAQHTRIQVYRELAQLFGMPEEGMRVWHSSAAAPQWILNYKDKPADLVDWPNLFIESKNPDEDVKLADNSTVLYLKFFSLKWDSPIQYIGSVTIQEAKPVSDLVVVVNSTMGFPADTRLVFYKETTATLSEVPVDKLIGTYCPTGTILIFQIPPGADMPETTFRPEHLQVVPVEVEEAPKGFLVTDFEGIVAAPETAPEFYLREVSSLIEVSVFAYSAPRDEVCVLQCPKSILFHELAKFVVAAAKVQYDAECDKLLLYKKDLSFDQPAKSVLSPNQPNKFSRNRIY
jgi:hypothetical protein